MSGKKEGRKYIIIDTAMTFGLPGRRLDQALALLYLLEQQNSMLLGITLAASSVSGDRQQAASAWFLRLCRISGIPVIPTEAAPQFIAMSTRAHPQAVTVLSIDGVANITGAAALHGSFYADVQRIIVLGGKQFPLQTAGWDAGDDLLLHTDPVNAQSLFDHCSTLSLVDMHVASLFKMTLEECLRVKSYSTTLYYLLKEYLLSEECFGRTGRAEGVLWALGPALYAASPESFSTRRVSVALDSRDPSLLQFTAKGNTTLVEYPVDFDRAFERLHVAWSAGALADDKRSLPGGGC